MRQSLASSLERIFEVNVKAGQLAIVGDSRANRLVIRGDDRIYVQVRNLVEELDVEQPVKQSTARSQSRTSPLTPVVNERQESLRRIVQAIKDSNDDPNMPYRDQLRVAVQHDFDSQQQQLRTELAELRTKLSSLQAMLEKRQSERNSICLKRIQALLSGQTTEQPSTNDPSFSNPLSSPSSVNTSVNEPAAAAAGENLPGRDVCLVNDSDQTILFTVVSGPVRFEKRLERRTHFFVTIDTTVDDRVVFVQTVSDSDDKSKAPMKVVTTQSLAGNSAGRWNFCYVHSNANGSLSADLLGWVCLDIVPLDWQQTNEADFATTKAKLIASLKNTTEADSATENSLKKNLNLASGWNRGE